MTEQRAREVQARAREDEMARCDVRDVEELQIWANQLGYKHGYSGKPFFFSTFSLLMRTEKGRNYPGLDPRYYESSYVGGHMHGAKAAVTHAAYAMEHGETRPPVSPFIKEE